MVQELVKEQKVTQNIQNYDFEQLLKGKPYIPVGTQIIFKQNGNWCITNINNNLYRYTVSDYQELPEGAPYQLVNGKLIFMPSPFDIHQKISGNLFLEMGFFVKKNQLGEVRYAPLDVHFDKENLYQPDLLFISNARKHIIKKHIYGAPDLVVEILSEGTKNVDEDEKMKVYGQFNVLEYWIIDPNEQTIDIYVNKNKVMVLREQIEKKGKVVSKAIPGFYFELSNIW